MRCPSTLSRPNDVSEARMEMKSVVMALALTLIGENVGPIATETFVDVERTTADPPPVDTGTGTGGMHMNMYMRTNGQGGTHTREVEVEVEWTTPDPVNTVTVTATGGDQTGTRDNGGRMRTRTNPEVLTADKVPVLRRRI